MNVGGSSMHGIYVCRLNIKTVISTVASYSYIYIIV